MKNFATRVLALVIALSVLLLPACALAAPARDAISLSISNLYMHTDYEEITLPLTLKLDLGADLEAARGYGMLSLLADGTSAISAMAAVEDGAIKAYLNGMSYGLSMTIEQLMTVLAPVLSEMESELPAEGLNPEQQAAVERLTAAIEGLADEAAKDPEGTLQAYYDALNLTVITGTKADTITLYGQEVSAVPTALILKDITLADLVNGLTNATPAMTEYYDAYFNFLSVLFSTYGEEMPDINEALASAEGTLSMAGTVHTAANALSVDVVLSITVEDETVDFPIVITQLSGKDASYFDFLLEVSDVGYDETMSLSAHYEAAQNNADLNLTFHIYETSTNETDSIMTFKLYSKEEAEGQLYGAEFFYGEYGYPTVMRLEYLAMPAEHTAAGDSYSGKFSLFMDDSFDVVEIKADTNVTLTNMPSGELLALSSSINPLEADDAAFEQLSQDAMNALMQGLSTLMQNPVMADLLN